MTDHAARFRRDYATEQGMIFDQDQRTVDELAVDVINLAIEYGWDDADAAALLDYCGADNPEHLPEWVKDYGYEDAYNGDTDAALGQVLADVAFDASNSATDHLNTLVPDDLYVGSEGGAFGVWNVEDA